MNTVRRPPRDRVDGVVLLDKPIGISSNAALQRVRRVFNAAKGGHTGTLDPLATGLLPLCLGEATKFSQALLDADKTYEAELRLGVRTDTGDAEGAVIETLPVSCTGVDLAAACARLVGEIEQVPPMYSALKVAGRPLYDYARGGVTLERKARRIRIDKLDVIESSHDRVRIVVACSKGTYIRVLAEDIGRLLGCGAHLTALRRTRIAGFGIEQAVELARLEEDPAGARAWLLPTDFLIGGWPRVDLNREATSRFLHGQPIPSASAAEAEVRVFGFGGRFLGTAHLSDGLLRPRRLVGAAGSDEISQNSPAGVESTAKNHV